MSQRTSVLAALGFLSGLVAAAAVAVGVALAAAAEAGDVLQAPMDERKALLLGAKVLFWCSLAPAAAAVAFWLGARSVVRASDGALRGLGLYRTGLVCAVVSILAGFGGQRSPGTMADEALRRHAAGSAILAGELPAGHGRARATVALHAVDLPLDHLGRATGVELRRQLPFVVHDEALRSRVEDRARALWPGDAPSSLELLQAVRLGVAREGEAAVVRVEAQAAGPGRAAQLADLFAEEWVRKSGEELLAGAKERAKEAARELRHERDAERRRALEEEVRKCEAYVAKPSAPLSLYRRAAEAVEKNR